MSSLNNNHCSASPPRRATPATIIALFRQSADTPWEETLWRLEVSIGEDRARKFVVFPPGRRWRGGEIKIWSAVSFRRCEEIMMPCVFSSVKLLLYSLTNALNYDVLRKELPLRCLEFKWVNGA